MAGLFNVPTQAVFDACTDFCIESSVAANSQDVVKILESQGTRVTVDASLKRAQQRTFRKSSTLRHCPALSDPSLPLPLNGESVAHKIDSLSSGLQTSVKKGLDTRLELESVLERSRDLASQIVLLEEQRLEDKRKLAAATKSHKDLKRETDIEIGSLKAKLGPLSAALATSADKITTLSSEIKRLTTVSQVSSEKVGTLVESKSQLELAVTTRDSRIATLESSLKSSESAKSELQASKKRIEELEEENRRLKENAARSSAVEEELQAGLKSLTEAYVLLQEQHNQLSGTASRLQADNFELRNASSGSDQNDILNQRLLSHYRYLVQLTEDQESDEGGSDSEAWK